MLINKEILFQRHTQCHATMYGKHSHIRQSVVLIYRFLLDVSSPIEDHDLDPRKTTFSKLSTLVYEQISIRTRINFSRLFHVSKSVSIVNHV